MPDTTKQIKICGTVIENTTVFSDTKLQTLDRRVGKDQLFFDREQFAKSLDAWNGIPVIFHPSGRHPDDFDRVTENPSLAAEVIGGKHVGYVNNPRIVVPGGARLMAELRIESDESEVVNLWQEGKLFPSTAFSVYSDGDKITSPPIPNHVLLFPIEVDKVEPGDYGAFVNTLEVQTMKTESDTKEEESFIQRVKHALEVLKGQEQLEHSEEPKPEEPVAAPAAEPAVEVKTEETPAAETEEAAPAAEEVQTEEKAPEQVEAEPAAPAESEKDKQIAELTAKLEALQNSVSELEAVKSELSEMKAKAADAKFDTLLHSLPVGMTATEEQRTALRQQFDAGDMEGLLFTVLSHSNTASTGETSRTGTQYTNSTATAGKFEGVGDLCGVKVGN